MTISEFESKLNRWGHEQVPFLFLVDFELENPLAWPIYEVPGDILFSIYDFSNSALTIPPLEKVGVRLTKQPISFSDYKDKFEWVKERISLGDSYLANLTIKTKIDIDTSFEELFFRSEAKYKLCWKNKFLVFSPETFVQIKGNKIFSFPMKGTIDASLSHAEQLILSDPKELSEHVTIVDLIRNDLSAVAKNVKVNRFRYLEKIRTNQIDLFQVSSEIGGDLPDDYANHVGTILTLLLPAGSISGAPKKKTIQIIREAEKENRGFYTGVFGYFDGINLDSAVMIRFLEKDGNAFYYRSGGGITAQSEALKEYQEAIDKIYVPVY
jgi:para-aminobenzoate synthetase component 1